MSRQSAGGFARAASLSVGRRREIARDAANARWSGERKPKKTKPKRIKPVQHPHTNLKAQPTTTDLNSMQASTCRWCGHVHGLLCPMVKAYRYYPDGTLHEVEFHRPEPGVHGLPLQFSLGGSAGETDKGHNATAGQGGSHE